MNFHRFCLSLFLGFIMSDTLSASASLVDPLFSETFGDAKRPAVLLNAGAGSLGLTWPDLFCEELSQKGYFVI
ncbi:MAG: hypothetical protein H2057_00215 [Alphaproteobacteria bacterium]|nr:hypothetical protein [Alphaproteobacteria bacterium]